MGYKEFLSQMVNDSHMTLREIADRAREKGVSIDPSYISKLQTGKQPPASEEITRILAEVCGGDPDSLIWEAYMEKAPDIIKDFINAVLSEFKVIVKTWVAGQYSHDENVMQAINFHLEKMSPLQFIKEVNSMKGTIFEPNSNALIVEDDKGKKQKMVFSRNEEMLDNSMEPIIPKGSQVIIKPLAEYKNGDIIVMALDNEENLIRKVVFNNDRIIALPLNSHYETRVLTKEEIDIIGKVTAVTSIL